MANSEDVNALIVYVFLNTKKKIQYTRRLNLMIIIVLDILNAQIVEKGFG
jgi:hypothetical protein